MPSGLSAESFAGLACGGLQSGRQVESERGMSQRLWNLN